MISAWIGAIGALISMGVTIRSTATSESKVALTAKMRQKRLIERVFHGSTIALSATHGTRAPSLRDGGAIKTGIAVSASSSLPTLLSSRPRRRPRARHRRG